MALPGRSSGVAALLATRFERVARGEGSGKLLSSRFVTLFDPVLRALQQSGTRYAVVGGLATVLHGHARMTADIDVIVDLAPEAALAVVVALTHIGLRPRAPVAPEDFANASIRRSWIEEKAMRVFSLWDPRNPMIEVDLFVEYPIDFEGLMARAVEVDALGTRVRIAAIEDLIALKRLADRPQDREDIRALEALALGKRGRP